MLGTYFKLLFAGIDPGDADDGDDPMNGDGDVVPSDDL